MDLTPTQQRIFEVLSDGQPHTREELRACLHDELGSLSNIKAHLTAIRKQLRLRDRDILCIIINRRLHYRYVRIVS